MNPSNFLVILIAFTISCASIDNESAENTKPRIIVTSDGEIDDECSMVRFLLYANEFDIEGIVTSSSQYHWRGHKWAGDNWLDPYLEAYSEVYPNLILHDKGYPSPDYLKSIAFLGNVDSEGEMDSISAGSQHIVKVLLDESDDRSIWIQAWGGMNTIARALKTIEEEHPEKMEYVANKIRLFFIWEQDSTYQYYIRHHWEKYNIQTIISDQFIAIMYYWEQTLPKEQQKFFKGEWMMQNILLNHGTLCSLYKARENGDFRSEGDSPAFLHNVETGLRNMESPGYGGWGGRYIKVRNNTWLDPVADPLFQYPQGRWYGNSAWGRERLRENIPDDSLLLAYLKPIWRWTDAMQNDFAARADWCVEPYEQANHQPIVILNHKLNLCAKPGTDIQLNANVTSDPDGDELTYHWWRYDEADSFDGSIEIENANSKNATFIVPEEINDESTIHIILEVSDNGSPQLTRYKRVIIEINP